MNASWLSAAISAVAANAVFYAAGALVLLLAVWLCARLLFRSEKSGEKSSAAKEPAAKIEHRLAVLDIIPIDARRHLILIRRDNREHLLLIGGDSDIVVESFADSSAAKNSAADKILIGENEAEKARENRRQAALRAQPQPAPAVSPHPAEPRAENAYTARPQRPPQAGADKTADNYQESERRREFIREAETAAREAAAQSERIARAERAAAAERATAAERAAREMPQAMRTSRAPAEAERNNAAEPQAGVPYRESPVPQPSRRPAPIDAASRSAEAREPQRNRADTEARGLRESPQPAAPASAANAAMPVSPSAAPVNEAQPKDARAESAARNGTNGESRNNMYPMQNNGDRARFPNNEDYAQAKSMPETDRAPSGPSGNGENNSPAYLRRQEGRGGNADVPQSEQDIYAQNRNNHAQTRANQPIIKESYAPYLGYLPKAGAQFAPDFPQAAHNPAPSPQIAPLPQMPNPAQPMRRPPVNNTGGNGRDGNYSRASDNSGGARRAAPQWEEIRPQNGALNSDGEREDTLRAPQNYGETSADRMNEGGRGASRSGFHEEILRRNEGRYAQAQDNNQNGGNAAARRAEQNFQSRQEPRLSKGFNNNGNEAQNRSNGFAAIMPPDENDFDKILQDALLQTPNAIKFPSPQKK